MALITLQRSVPGDGACIIVTQNYEYKEGTAWFSSSVQS